MYELTKWSFYRTKRRKYIQLQERIFLSIKLNKGDKHMINNMLINAKQQYLLGILYDYKELNNIQNILDIKER